MTITLSEWKEKIIRKMVLKYYTERKETITSLVNEAISVYGLNGNLNELKDAIEGYIEQNI